MFSLPYKVSFRKDMVILVSLAYPFVFVTIEAPTAMPQEALFLLCISKQTGLDLPDCENKDTVIFSCATQAADRKRHGCGMPCSSCCQQDDFLHTFF